MDGSSVLTFQYNQDGIRTSKTVDGVKHTYLLSGSQIVGETWGNNLLIYLYDESGSPIGMQYRNNGYDSYDFDTFYFEKNLQGDIVAVYNESGEKVLGYTYDAWGNHTLNWYSIIGNDLLARYNPFRYRGYYYDTETKLYYLQSRYYDPYAGRFLNADGYVNANGDLIGFNMYAYCSNNPVMGYDPTGKSWSDIINFLSDGLTEMQNDFASFMGGILDFARTFCDSVVVDIGIGAGLGLGAEAGGFEGEALIRSDFITIRKDAGKNSLFYYGHAEEQYLSVEGIGCVMESGENEFIYADGFTENLPVVPHFNTTLSVGGKAYFGLGATVSIGFDWNYLLSNIFS